MGIHKVSAFHRFIFQKSGKSTIIRNLAVPRHFVAYLVFISSIHVDPGPRNRGPTSLLALKIRTPVANMGKLRSIGQVPVLQICQLKVITYHNLFSLSYNGYTVKHTRLSTIKGAYSKKFQLQITLIYLLSIFQQYRISTYSEKNGGDVLR